MTAAQAINHLFDELSRASAKDMTTALYVYFSPELDAPFILDADARALHDALVDLAKFKAIEE